MEHFHPKEITLLETPHTLKRSEYNRETDLSTNNEINFMIAFRDTLVKQGYCYVYINDKNSDYYGSVAKFIIDEEYQPNFVQSTYNNEGYNINSYFYGRLRWKGKANKPKYTLRSGDIVLIGEDTDTIFKRVDKVAEKQRALDEGVCDIHNTKLEVGDKVVYISTVYGGGASLCHGVINEFKAIHTNGHTRIETYVKDDATDFVSKCNYTTDQVWKK